MSVFGALRKRLFGILPREATFGRRGFQSPDARARQRLEQVGGAFISGYNLALGETDAMALSSQLRQQTPGELHGFAFEGAAMGLALVDWITFSKNLRRWNTFVRGPGASHVYMVHVGAGWAAARIGWIRGRLERQLGQFDPLLRWLVIDGFGFHQGYFHPRRFIAGQEHPRHLSPAALHVFDQGLGRSLWFVAGANIEHITQQIGVFPHQRQGDLWSGVGLACAYAGGVERSAIDSLLSSAGPWRPQLAQGAAFAAKTRQRAGNLTEHTESACRVLCGLSADEAAAVTDESLRELPPGGEISAYEMWRRRIQIHFDRALAGAAPTGLVQ